MSLIKVKVLVSLGLDGKKNCHCYTSKSFYTFTYLAHTFVPLSPDSWFHIHHNQTWFDQHWAQKLRGWISVRFEYQIQSAVVKYFKIIFFSVSVLLGYCRRNIWQGHPLLLLYLQKTLTNSKMYSGVPMLPPKFSLILTVALTNPREL